MHYPGAYPPPPEEAPVEAPLTSDDRALIRSAGRWGQIAGLLAAISALLGGLFSVVNEGVPGLARALVSGVIGVLLAIWFWQAGTAFARVSERPTLDQPELIKGFDHLRSCFHMLGIVMIIALVLVGLGVLVGVCAAAA